MSDPRYRDPINNPPRPGHEPAPRAIVELEKSNNAMWGWIAGAVAVLLVLVFVFAGGSDNSRTATDSTPASPPAATTGSAPPARSPPAAAAQSPARPAPGSQPSTTGQGNAN